MASLSCSFLLSILCAIYLKSTVLGDCLFPTNYQNRFWFRLYLDSSLQQFIYRGLTTNIDDIRTDNQTNQNTHYPCSFLWFDTSDSTSSTLYYIYSNFGTQICAKSVLTVDVASILLQEVTVSNSVTDASQCSAFFTANCTSCGSLWMPAVTSATPPPSFGSSPCPFLGLFHLTATINGSSECSSDPSSLAFFSSSSAQLNLCGQGTLRNSTFKSRTLLQDPLTCMASVDGRALNPTEAGSTIALLRDNNALYCARFKNVSGGLELLINVKTDSLYAGCSFTPSPTNQVLQLILTPITSTPGITTPTTLPSTTTSSRPSTPPVPSTTTLPSLPTTSTTAGISSSSSSTSSGTSTSSSISSSTSTSAISSISSSASTSSSAATIPSATTTTTANILPTTTTSTNTLSPGSQSTSTPAGLNTPTTISTTTGYTTSATSGSSWSTSPGGLTATTPTGGASNRPPDNVEGPSDDCPTTACASPATCNQATGNCNCGTVFYAYSGNSSSGCVQDDRSIDTTFRNIIIPIIAVSAAGSLIAALVLCFATRPLDASAALAAAGADGGSPAALQSVAQPAAALQEPSLVFVRYGRNDTYANLDNIDRSLVTYGDLPAVAPPVPPSNYVMVGSSIPAKM